MKVIFSHDHIFYNYDGHLYSNGGLSYDVLSRYTKVFGEVTVLSRQKNITDKEKVENLTKASGQYVTFVKVPNFKSLKTLNKYPSAKKRVYKEVKTSDIVIARLPSSISKLVVEAAIKFKKPYLIELVGCAWDANINHGSRVGKVIAYYEYRQLKNIISEAPYVVYITKNFLQSRYPNGFKSAICPNVKISRVNRLILEKRLQKIEENKEGSVRLGLIGSLDVKYKGHETLLKALKEIRDRDIIVEFLGKGDNSYWKEMAEELGVSHKVFFKGTLSGGEAVYQWIDSLDIMIQPSTAEAQGRSIIEGMSRGCPLIATRVGGIVELIDDSCLIDKKDYVGLSRVISSLIDDKEKMKKAAIENFEASEEYYDYLIEEKRNSFFEEFKREALNV